MKAGGRFVEYEQSVFLFLLRDIIGKFHTLALSSGECRRTLPQFHISESHLLKRKQFVDDPAFGGAFRFTQEFYGLVHGHFQKIVDIPATVFHIEHFLLETFSMAGFAFHADVGHELHRDGYCAFSFAFLAAPSLGIEGKVSRSETHLACQLLFREETSDLVVGFQIGGGITS